MCVGAVMHGKCVSPHPVHHELLVPLATPLQLHAVHKHQCVSAASARLVHLQAQGKKESHQQQMHQSILHNALGLSIRCQRILYTVTLLAIWRKCQQLQNNNVINLDLD